MRVGSTCHRFPYHHSQHHWLILVCYAEVSLRTLHGISLDLRLSFEIPFTRSMATISLSLHIVPELGRGKVQHTMKDEKMICIGSYLSRKVASIQHRKRKMKAKLLFRKMEKSYRMKISNKKKGNLWAHSPIFLPHNLFPN